MLSTNIAFHRRTTALSVGFGGKALQAPQPSTPALDTEQAWVGYMGVRICFFLTCVRLVLAYLQLDDALHLLQDVSGVLNRTVVGAHTVNGQQAVPRRDGPRPAGVMVRYAKGHTGHGPSHEDHSG